MTKKSLLLFTFLIDWLLVEWLRFFKTRERDGRPSPEGNTGQGRGEAAAPQAVRRAPRGAVCPDSTWAPGPVGPACSALEAVL